jgi:hypothetical protein
LLAVPDDQEAPVQKSLNDVRQSRDDHGVLIAGQQIVPDENEVAFAKGRRVCWQFRQAGAA